MPYRSTDVVEGPIAPAVSPQKIRWGAVFAGTVLGLALFALISALWFALGFGSGVEPIRADLSWYIGISAIVCLFLGGLLSGWLSGVRGAGSGFFSGMTIWAMILIITLAVGLPSVLSVFNLGGVTHLARTTASGGAGIDSTLWATFWAILGGLLACSIGGALGGAVTRPANADLHLDTAPYEPRDHDLVVDDDRERGDEAREESVRAF